VSLTSDFAADDDVVQEAFLAVTPGCKTLLILYRDDSILLDWHSP
jgi:hypothetical protein